MTTTNPSFPVPVSNQLTRTLATGGRRGSYLSPPQPERQAEEDGVEDDVDAGPLGIDADQRAVRGQHSQVQERLGHATLAENKEKSGDERGRQQRPERAAGQRQ